ncbi:GDSL-type esterase/lipase family protein [Paenibacillus sp. CN-4]|uniref:GDSL-type esterase/lipase family protein n=1 Tax=Paenibacillus nanchangensis TaxID=3348343 RepID=UPI00397D3476
MTVRTKGSLALILLMMGTLLSPLGGSVKAMYAAGTGEVMKPAEVSQVTANYLHDKTASHPSETRAAVSAAVYGPSGEPDGITAELESTPAKNSEQNQADLADRSVSLEDLREDVNQDGIVGVGDLGITAFYYGKSEGSVAWDTAKRGDVNRDGTIDKQDLMLVSAYLLGTGQPGGETDGTYKFNFAKTHKEGFIHVKFDSASGVPLFQASSEYGFVAETSAMPPRQVHTSGITAESEGFVIQESAFAAEPGYEKDNYNHYGMAFRVKAPPGAYDVYVKTTSGAGETTVSISGMQTSRLLKGGYWDAAQLVPVRNVMQAQGREWSYRYVNGRDFIDIEIEPNRINTPVGVSEIVLTPVPVKERADNALPKLFVLGDSTVKSYLFEEAPMSGWGQVFDRFFDPGKVDVVNYSMGGRSFKNAYTEGRLNDVLLTGSAGDYVLIQFGHNDESADENRRFARGATEEMYAAYIRDLYIPAVRSRGMIPVLVTPVSRVKGDAAPGYEYKDSFTNRKFPSLMRQAGAELGVTVLDLNAQSVKYYNEIGVEATTALFMSIEAGETPGKTNDGSYANGHPSQKVDGTHFKEALAKQLARMVVSELADRAAEGDAVGAALADLFKPEVKAALAGQDWTVVFPEIAKDTTAGKGAYYRNQIEKLIQLGVMETDEAGNFNPEQPMTVGGFTGALSGLMELDPTVFTGYTGDKLNRETMGAILYDAYHAKFTALPKYMTDYNKTTAVPGSPEYDPDLDPAARGVMYYPIVSFQQLTDTQAIDQKLFDKVKGAYDLGLIRSEKGIVRGKIRGGTELEPKGIVTRAKAAKALYFMWVLFQSPSMENDVSVLGEPAAH